MRCLGAILVFVNSLLEGGVIGGIVLEHRSGVPLARSRVRLDRVDLSGRVQSETVIAGRAGQFTFSGVADGLYVLTASRDGYAPIAFGQRRPHGTGPAFAVDKDANLFAELRLRKLGALTGRVLDENRIGIRRVGVSAFSVKPPFRPVGTAESDDRGVFRIHGLAEGKYRLRSQPFRHDDGLTLLPTFAPEMLPLRDSTVASARYDSETTDLDVIPIPGSLISVGGTVTCSSPLPVAAITVTLSTDTGRRQTRAVCNGNYLFDNVAPGYYEVFGTDADGKISAFVEQRIFQAARNIALELRPTPTVDLSVRDEAGRASLRVMAALTLRRVDAAGVAETRTVRIDEQGTVAMPPGWWEVAATMPAPYHLAGLGLNFRQSEPRASADPDWFELSLPSNPRQLVLRTSDRSGSIAGRVLEKLKGVPAIPVFLWPVEPDTRRRAGGPRLIAANIEGEFLFDALPTGSYRLMASFDYDEVDDEILLAANAPLVTVEPSTVRRVELSPYLAP